MPPSGDFQGRTLAGRFELVRLLGVGAFSRVFEAIDTSSGGRVAVKVLLPLWASRERVRARFVREAELLVRVRSPCAVRIHGLGHDLSDGPFLVMELLEGPLLSAFVDRSSDGSGRLPYRMAARVCSQVAEALAAVHDRLLRSGQGVRVREQHPAVQRRERVHGQRHLQGRHLPGLQCPVRRRQLYQVLLRRWNVFNRREPVQLLR